MSTSSTVVLILAVFGASTVEMVEALTIVVAAGVTRSWRSSLKGRPRPRPCSPSSSWQSVSP